MSCGGHGFSSASAFPEIYGAFSPTCTFEGENTVMLLQTARFLMKSARQAMKGAKLTPFMSYLLLNQHERCRASKPDDFLDMDTLLLAYSHRARRMVTTSFRCIEADLKEGKNNGIAWNNNHLHLLAASTAHCHLFVVDSFNKAVEAIQCEDRTRRILRVLVQFYALDGILKNKGEFLESGYITVDQLDLVSKQFISLLAVIRPNAVALVDAFDLRDLKLGSVLGRYDGNVYENLYKWAKSAPLNKKDTMLRAGQSSTEPQDRLQHGSGDICQSCLSEGRKSRVRKFQINPEECVFSCSSEKCLSNFSSSSLILKRKASEIPNLRKRRRKSCPVQERPPDLPRSNVTLLWQNKQALCWLDSSLLLMVFCTSLRKCLFASKDELSLKQLCKYFDDAQLKLEAIFNRTRTTCSKSNNTDESLCYSDPPHDNYQFDTKTSKETYSNFGDPLELLQALGEIPSISLLQNDEENSLIELDRISSEDPELSEAVSVLDESRERIWEQLQPELRCKKDDEESPVFALPLLLRKNKQFEAHFRSSYHWQFYCSRCHFVEICHEKRVVLSLKTLNRSLSPTSYFSLRVCPYCQSPQGRNRLVIHKLPACPMFHFVDGLPPLKSWEQLEFHHGSYDYKVAAIIQYQQNPNHFVAWIRDNHRNLWLEGDDLKQPVVRWREEEPKFPASQAHLVMWERQGGCSECLEEQELVKNILVADNSELKQVLQRPQGNLMDSGEKIQVVNYLKAYIPKRTQDLSPIGAHASKATETSHQCTESSSRAKRKISEESSVRSSEMTSTDAKSKNNLKNPKRRPLIGHSLASKFAAFSETLQSFVEYKEMMAERKRKNSKILSRSTRMGSVSPLCSPSGSSEASSLPDSCQNMFPELDLILEDFRQTQGGMPDMSSELELFMQTL